MTEHRRQRRHRPKRNVRVSRSQAARFLADKLHHQMFDFIDARRHYVFVSCLVVARRSSASPCGQPVRPWLARAFTSRRNTAAAVHELLNSSYLLLKSRTVRVRRGCRKEFDRDTRRRAERTRPKATGRRRMAREEQRGIRHILSWPREIIYYPPVRRQHEDICTWLRRASRAKHLVRSSELVAALCGSRLWWDMDESSVDITVYERS